MAILFLLISLWLAIDVPVALALGRFQAAGGVRRHG
jgi:hypothetical protein